MLEILIQTEEEILAEQQRIKNKLWEALREGRINHVQYATEIMELNRKIREKINNLNN